MKLTTITVSYNRTQSLENYSNVRVGQTMTAELTDGDDPGDVTAQLYREVRGFVEEVCDQALEADDRPAKFSVEPRFTVWSIAARYGHRTERLIPPEPLVIITPDAIPLPSHEAGRNWAVTLRCGLRLAHARRVAQAEVHKRDARLIDCPDGDLSRIPPWVIAPIPDPEPTPDPKPDADEGSDETPF